MCLCTQRTGMYSACTLVLLLRATEWRAERAEEGGEGRGGGLSFPHLYRRQSALPRAPVPGGQSPEAEGSGGISPSRIVLHMREAQEAELGSSYSRQPPGLARGVLRAHALRRRSGSN